MKDSTVKVSHALQSIGEALDRVIEDVAGERIPFTLIVFTEGRASYLSSALREDSVREIKDLLAHWEGGMPDIPAHEVQ
jgi:hypothetical protein